MKDDLLFFGGLVVQLDFCRRGPGWARTALDDQPHACEDDYAVRAVGA